MYGLYLLASITTFYYIYKTVKKILTTRKAKFEDSLIDDRDTKINFLEITYEDNTKEFLDMTDEYNTKDFLENINSCILNTKNPIKYATLCYYTGDNSHFILFSKNNLKELSCCTFPFYNNIVKLPLYREVAKAVVFANDYEYDITDILLKFAGPKLNYHNDIVKIRFEEIVDYYQKFPELNNVTGIINIDDNFGDKHIYNYPGEFIWEENLLN